MCVVCGMWGTYVLRDVGDISVVGVWGSVLWVVNVVVWIYLKRRVNNE